MTDSLQCRGEALASQDVIVERFVRPGGTAPSVHDHGFLPDIDTLYGKIASPHTVRLEDILESRCTVLLGEPGIGKSTVMALRRHAIGEEAVAFDLRCDSARAVLECSEVLAWQHGQRELHLIIDSIDEADNSDFARLFWGVLRKGPAAQLRLEMACRAAEWPKVLKAELPQIFSSDEVKYFHVEPLRRQDVAAIAGSRGVDGNEFLDAVHRGGLGALAAVPMTLRLLLTLYKKNVNLPSSPAEIYEKACLELCQEHSDTKPIKPHRLDATVMLDRAAEIAAICILCRRGHLVDASIASLDSELPILELVHILPSLSEGVVRETLRTGLFSGRSQGSWGWFHQSFPEFLTARWISRSAISEVQLRQLLFHPSNSSALVPQLAGVATWLGAMDPRVANLLSRYAPETFVAIRSDMATNGQRAVATETLLRRFASLESTDWLSRDEARRLSHPQLSLQLSPYISDSNTNLAALKRAISIAASNELADLAPAVCALAVNKTMSASIRAESIDAAFLMAPDASQVAILMRSLLESDAAEKVPDDVRGAILKNLWPRWISSKELFQFLTTPIKSFYTGGYDHFLWNLRHSLQSANLLDALAWVDQLGRQGHLYDWLSTEKLSSSICRTALDQAENEQVRTALAALVLHLLQKAQPIFRNNERDPEIDMAVVDPGRLKARLLLGELSKITNDPSHDAFLTVSPFGEAPFATDEDVPWLLEQWRNTKGSAQEYFCHVIYRLVGQTSTRSSLALVLNEIGDERESPLLPIPRWVELDSEEAATQKAVHQSEIRHFEFLKRQQEEKSAAKQKRELLFTNATAGDEDSWLQYVTNANGEAKSGQLGYLESIFHLTERTNEETSRLVACAEQYLIRQHDSPIVPSRKTQHEKSAGPWVAYLSLRLLHLKTPDSERLARYSGICINAVVALSVYYLEHETDRAAHRILMMLGFTANQSKFLESLRWVLERDVRQNSSPAIWNYLPKEGTVCDAIVELAEELGNRKGVGMLLEGLLIVDRERAVKWAAAHVRSESKDPRKQRWSRLIRRKRNGDRNKGNERHWWRSNAMLVSIARCREQIAPILARDGRSDSWELAWQICLLEPHLAWQIFPNLHDKLHDEDWGATLADTQLSSLFEWLEQHVPIIKDEDDDFSFESRFRQGLVTRLANRGTAEAVQQLQRLQLLFPESTLLKYAYSRATQQMLENSWSPLSSADFTRFFANGGSRLVSSDEQLLAVVFEALEAYQLEIQGETPAVGDLWSNSFVDRHKLYRPKDENDFSDHLARFLRRQLSGTVVNREVEIRPHDADRAGEHIDLLIQATYVEKHQTFQVVVEAKGSWNPSLETDVENQLRNRYLAHGNIHCGIYLVGWFACANWDSKDWRQRATRKRNRADIATLLEAKALELSTDGRQIRVLVLDLTMGNSTAGIIQDEDATG